MPGKTGSRTRKGGRGACSYCGKTHRRGKKRGDSCRGHKPIAEVSNVKRINYDKFDMPTK